MKVIWAVLCQNAVIDKYTNNISLFNIIEEIMVSADVPQEESGEDFGVGIPVNMELVTLWTRSNQDVRERGHG
jgi:hypothetical protein